MFECSHRGMAVEISRRIVGGRALFVYRGQEDLVAIAGGREEIFFCVYSGEGAR